MDSCISLGTNSRYSASWDDGVYFEAGDGPHLDSVRESSNAFLSQTTAGGRYMEFILELQVKYCFFSEFYCFLTSIYLYS